MCRFKDILNIERFMHSVADLWWEYDMWKGPKMVTNNPYKDDIDFAVLALQDADFAKMYVTALKLSKWILLSHL